MHSQLVINQDEQTVKLKAMKSLHGAAEGQVGRAFSET
jgi:hypothetical protein